MCDGGGRTLCVCVRGGACGESVSVCGHCEGGGAYSGVIVELLHIKVWVRQGVRAG